MAARAMLTALAPEGRDISSPSATCPRRSALLPRWRCRCRAGHVARAVRLRWPGVAQNNGLIVDIYAATFAAFHRVAASRSRCSSLTSKVHLRCEVWRRARFRITLGVVCGLERGTLSRHATALLTLSIAVAVARLMLFGLLRAIVRAPCTVPVTVPPSMVAGDGSWARCGGVRELQHRLGLITDGSSLQTQQQQ